MSAGYTGRVLRTPPDHCPGSDNLKKFTILGAILCVLAVFGSEARATTALAVSMEEQVASARAIVIGRCQKIESRSVDGAIVPYISLDVREVLKGRVSLGTLVVKQPGGLVGENGSWIYGSPRFDVGRDAAVFLASNGAGAYVVDGMFLGNFFLEKGDDGREWLRRDTGGEGVQVLSNKNGITAQDMPATLPLSDLRAIVSRTASKGGVLFADDVPQIPAEYGQPFEGESGVSPAFTLLNRCRWFEPDTGVTVLFSSNSSNFTPGGSGPPPSIAAALTDALAAWSTVPECSLRLANGGEDTNYCGWGPADGKSMVSVDCHNEISGESCRSIIAIGGGHYTTQFTVVVNGTTFYKIKESDVALQDGYCDYFQDPVALREVLTHELGHCIGLGHSEDRNANMAGFIHNDRRGATLTEDDRNGARFIYPAPSGGGGGGGGGGDPEPPTIATTSLPDATVGFTYTSQFAVTNGKEPFAWTLTSGTLPVGIALSGSGLLSGAPTLAGTFQFSVRVTDTLGRVDGKFFTIRVKVPPPAIAAASYRAGKKTLTVSGQYFEAGAQFEINGVPTVPPKPPTFNSTAGSYSLKGSRKKLNLRKPSDGNTIVVIIQGERSQPFAF